MSASAVYEWDPTALFDPAVVPPRPYALLVLNTPLNANAYQILRKNASYTVCADGGANRLYAVAQQHPALATDLPDLIVGDLDSIKPHVRAHYAARGVDVLHVPEQLSTDFGKALRLLHARRPEILRRAAAARAHAGTPTAEGGEDAGAQLDVVVMGGLGGRLDQAVSQLQHVYRAASSADPRDAYFQDGRVVLVSEASVSFFCPPGRSYVFTRPRREVVLPEGFPRGEEKEEEVVGRMEAWPADHPYLKECSAMLPFGGPTVLTTSGFEWDVCEWESCFEGEISTSNHLRSDVVRVDTSGWVMFTAELADRLKLWVE